MPITRGTDKHNVVYTYMEYYLAVKRKEILTYVITQINLEDIRYISEINQAQKTKTVIPLV